MSHKPHHNPNSKLKILQHIFYLTFWKGFRFTLSLAGRISVRTIVPTYPPITLRNRHRGNVWRSAVKEAAAVLTAAHKLQVSLLRFKNNFEDIPACV
jgi:hypothetical protein